MQRYCWAGMNLVSDQEMGLPIWLDMLGRWDLRFLGVNKCTYLVPGILSSRCISETA